MKNDPTLEGLMNSPDPFVRDYMRDLRSHKGARQGRFFSPAPKEGTWTLTLITQQVPAPDPLVKIHREVNKDGAYVQISVGDDAPITTRRLPRTRGGINITIGS